MVDNAGITRLKMIPIRRLATVAEYGVGISSLMGIFTIDDHAAYLPGAEGLENPSGDMRLVPDLAAAVRLSGDEGLAWAPVDQIHQNGEPTPTCQRTFLRTMQATAAARGLGFRMAFEVEFTLLPARVALRTWPAFSAPGLFEVEDFALALVTACEEQGLLVDQFQAEAGPGQFEIAISADEPLAAADRYVLLRQTIRRIAAAHGHDVSFAPAHGRLRGAGKRLPHPPQHLARRRESVRQRRAAAGLSRRRRGGGRAGCSSDCTRLPRSSPQASRATSGSSPSHWCGAYTTWGIDNREAALRLSRGMWTRAGDGRQLRAEAARRRRQSLPRRGHHHRRGARRHRSLGRACPTPSRKTPRRSPTSSSTAGSARRLPADLGEAAEALAGSQFAKDALGEVEHAAFVATRRNEWETFQHYDRSELVKFHELRYG